MAEGKSKKKKEVTTKDLGKRPDGLQAFNALLKKVAQPRKK